MNMRAGWILAGWLSVCGAVSLLAAPPANDTCAGAVLLTENVEYRQVVTNATHDPIVAIGYANTTNYGVWFRYVVPFDGETILAPGSNSVYAEVFTGACANLLRPPYYTGLQDMRTGQELLLCTVAFNLKSNNVGLRMYTIPHPVNDSCTNPLPLTEGVYANGDNSGARPDVGDRTTTDRGVWYSYTAPFTGTTHVDVVVAGDVFYPMANAYTGTCGALKEAPNGWDMLKHGFSCVAGQTYLIVVGKGGGLYQGPFQVRAVTTPAAPPNDACSGAIVLTEGAYATTVTLAGDSETSEVAGVISRGAWFTYTPSFSGIAHLDTCPSDFGTKLAVYYGPCGALQPVAVQDDSGFCGGLRAAVSFPCAAGVTYRICAGGTNGASGNLYLLAESEPLTNNTDCATAGVLLDRQSLVQNTASFPDALSVCAGTISNAAWFQYTPPFTGTAIVETCGSEFATILEAFSGDCSNLVSLGCSTLSAACSNRAALTFPCVAGTTYRLCAGGAPNGGLLRIVARAIGPRVPNDFDGDGRSDLGIFQPYYGNWVLQLSNGGQWRTNDVNIVKFGFDGTRLLEGDFDGDRIADLALYESKNYRWFLGRSKAGYTNFTFGYMGATPVTADFDGDGRSDPALYEPARGKWSIRNSTTGPTNFVFGFPGSMPAVADFDGDGRADPGCYRPDDGLWKIQLSGGGTLQTNYGAMIVLSDGRTDRAVPLPGDYDHDGLADLAVFYTRVPSNHLRVRCSSLGRVDITAGQGVDRTGDYDGNGRKDLFSGGRILSVGTAPVSLPPMPLSPPGQLYYLGDTTPLLERQFDWVEDMTRSAGTPITPMSGKTGNGRTFRIQFPSAGKRTTGLFTDASGASATIYLSGLNGAGFADSAGTPSTGPISMSVKVTKVDSFPLGPFGTPFGFMFISATTLDGTYRDQRGETTVTITFYGFEIATF